MTSFSTTLMCVLSALFFNALCPRLTMVACRLSGKCGCACRVFLRESFWTGIVGSAGLWWVRNEEFFWAVSPCFCFGGGDPILCSWILALKHFWPGRSECYYYFFPIWTEYSSPSSGSLWSHSASLSSWQSIFNPKAKRYFPWLFLPLIFSRGWWRWLWYLLRSWLILTLWIWATFFWEDPPYLFWRLHREV